jgi:hypothetical protein
MSTRDTAAGGLIGAIVAYIALLLLLKATERHTVYYRHGYTAGYCTALHATAVADSLCVRGDSIVGRVQR